MDCGSAQGVEELLVEASSSRPCRTAPARQQGGSSPGAAWPVSRPAPACWQGPPGEAAWTMLRALVVSNHDVLAPTRTRAGSEQLDHDGSLDSELDGSRGRTGRCKRSRHRTRTAPVEHGHFNEQREQDGSPGCACATGRSRSGPRPGTKSQRFRSTFQVGTSVRRPQLRLGPVRRSRPRFRDTSGLSPRRNLWHQAARQRQDVRERSFRRAGVDVVDQAASGGGRFCDLPRRRSRRGREPRQRRSRAPPSRPDACVPLYLQAFRHAEAATQRAPLPPVATTPTRPGSGGRVRAARGPNFSCSGRGRLWKQQRRETAPDRVEERRVLGITAARRAQRRTMRRTAPACRRTSSAHRPGHCQRARLRR